MGTIRKLQSGRWQGQIRVKGAPILSRTFPTKADAHRWIRSTETDIDTRGLPTNRRSLSKVRLADLLERYCDEVTPKKRGHRREACTIRLALNDPLASLSLDALTEAHAAEFRDKRLLTRMPATVVRELAVLGNVIEVAQRDWGLPISINPFYRVKKPKIRNARERRLSSTEWKDLRKGIAEGFTDTLEPIVDFALETALRLSEISNAKFIDVGLASPVLHVPITKNGHARTIPLTKRAQDIIRERRAHSNSDNDHLFDLPYASIRSAWRRASKRANIVDYRFHDLRHEAISRFFEKGLSVPEVALISGHRDYKMLARYVHLRPEDLAEKLTRIE